MSKEMDIIKIIIINKQTDDKLVLFIGSMYAAYRLYGLHNNNIIIIHVHLYIHDMLIL